MPLGTQVIVFDECLLATVSIAFKECPAFIIEFHTIVKVVLDHEASTLQHNFLACDSIGNDLPVVVTCSFDGNSAKLVRNVSSHH